jgi:GH24 family phage-related lysozyme (muramidase)
MSSATLTMSDAGLTFLKNEEGVIEGLYDDPSGYCTYGIGYLVHKQHSYLLKAAGSIADLSAYVKIKWANTANATTYLDRTVSFAPKFADLKTAALGTGTAKTTAQPFVDAEANVLGTPVETLLKQKLPAYEKAVTTTITHVDLTQNEFDALVSFTYNVGTPSFTASTLAKVIEEGKYKTGDAKTRKAAIDQIEGEFNKWVNSGGKKLAGLVSRRQHEAALFLQDARALLQKLEAAGQPAAGKFAPPNFGNSAIPGLFDTPGSNVHAHSTAISAVLVSE